jgi:hypothetical protein
MPEARLSISLPEGVWIGDISRTHDEVTFRVLAAVAAEDGGVALVEFESPDPEAVLDSFEGSGAVTTVDVLHQGDERTLLQFETDEPLLVLSAQQSALPLAMPIEIRDGAATVTVTAPRDRLAALGDQLESFGLRFTVEYVHRVPGPERLLTERQRRFLEAAVEWGYYETPRDCTLTELAERLDVAKSTASETLRRAEAAVVREFVSEE